MRLPKIGPRNTKSFFEEYFYIFLVVIFVAVAVLGKAAGLSGYDAAVSGLWVGGFTWFAGQAWRYRKEKAGPAKIGKSKQAAPQVIGKPLSPNLKPMIGPQWALKPSNGAGQPAQKPGPPGNKPVFVYERPTLPDRKPKLPANWPGPQKKKPKR